MKKYFNTEFEQKLINVCLNSKSMAQACAVMNMNKNTFIKHAKRLNCYKPNQSGKGISKLKIDKIPLIDILNNKYPQYQTSKLRSRLIKEGYKEYKCECCNLSEWLNKPIQLELHHIDGNIQNHSLDNLKILCPNCHAQTNNYKIFNSKNKSNVSTNSTIEPNNKNTQAKTRIIY